MEKIFINDNNLTKEDIDYTVTRVKGLIIDSNNKVLLADNNGTYQFPGGHVEEDEDMMEALIREVKEETGIDAKYIDGPFLEIETYADNYFFSGKKVCSKIYYYEIFSDDQPNFAETNYDELEKKTEFGLFYVDYDKLENFLKESLDKKLIDSDICREMGFVLKEYDKIYR